MKPINQYKLIFLTSIFFTAFCNFSFFKNVIQVYPLNENLLYITTATISLCIFIFLFFSILASRFTTKPFLILSLLITSSAAYFMDTYNVVIDTEMIRNILQTNTSESLDLLSFKLVFYFVFLGIIPSFIVYKIPIFYKKTIFTKFISIIVSIILLAIILFSFSKFYTSFFREHKPLRYYTNPTYWIYSTGKFIAKYYDKVPREIKKIALDASLENQKKKTLSIVVVGEALRADRFSLNGYERETSPLLKKENIVNFSNMYSCGTSTAVSVPCMFSIYTRNKYKDKKARYTQNVLDILSRLGVEVFWKDNNSDSKGVALRVRYEKLKCDGECRDIKMLEGLNDFISKHEDKNILIVLHQMGNHGPAYYKRYPKEFEKFKPVCKTNQLENCKKEEVSNAYDNAALYTDFFLSKAINFLKPYDEKYNVSLFYISDHGESLGENGLYLHGLPYFMAPKSQTHVASFIWFGQNSNYDISKLKSYANNKFSQDYLFSTILGLFNVKTKVYDEKLDINFNAKKTH